MAGFRGRVYRDLVINGTWNFAFSRFNLLFLVHVVFFSRLIVSHVTIVDYSPLDQRMDRNFWNFDEKLDAEFVPGKFEFEVLHYSFTYGKTN